MEAEDDLREAVGATDQPIWRAMRLDDTGNHFEIAHGLPRTKAQEMATQFEESGHKQFYWILPKSNGD